MRQTCQVGKLSGLSTFEGSDTPSHIQFLHSSHFSNAEVKRQFRAFYVKAFVAGRSCEVLVDIGCSKTTMSIGMAEEGGFMIEQNPRQRFITASDEMYDS